MAGMNSHRLRCAATVVLVAVLTPTTFPSPRNPARPPLPATIRIPVTVLDKETGAPYSQLNRERFQVLEDGVGQPITGFIPAEERTSAVILLEASRRLYWIYPGDARALLETLTASLASSLGVLLDAADYLALVSFDARPHVWVDFTSTGRPLQHALASLQEQALPRPSSNLYDALLFLLSGGTDDQGTEYRGMPEIGGKTAIILMATGWDTASRASAKVVWHRLERAGVPVHVIGLTELIYERLEPFVSSSALLGVARAVRTLRALAERSGGRFVELTAEGQLSSALHLIANALSGQYVLEVTLTPSGRRPGKHTIDVLVDVDGDGHPDNARLTLSHPRTLHMPKSSASVK